MAGWKDLAHGLNLIHAPFSVPMAMNQGTMEGGRDGHQIRIRQIDEYRRTARTGISLTFKEPLTIGLSMKASASSRGQTHWFWGVFAGLFLCAGIGGAIAALNPGPLIACLVGGGILWAWLAARRSATRMKAHAIPSGDPGLDRTIHVEADNRDRAAEYMRIPRVCELLTDLSAGDRELVVTDRKISLDINRVIKTIAEFEKELGNMSELASLLTPG
jgi:hypothetical protein